jgi:hypothetical protein
MVLPSFLSVIAEDSLAHYEVNSTLYLPYRGVKEVFSPSRFGQMVLSSGIFLRVEYVFCVCEVAPAVRFAGFLVIAALGQE